MMSGDQAACRGYPVMCCLFSAGQVASQVIDKSGLGVKLWDGGDTCSKEEDVRCQVWGDAVVGLRKSEVQDITCDSCLGQGSRDL